MSWGRWWGTTLLTTLCVLSDKRRAVCGRLCPAGPQLAAGHRCHPAAQRSLREASLHPGWLHADSSRQVTGTLLFGVERWGFPRVLPGHSWHPGSQQQEALANPNQCWEKREQPFALAITSYIHAYKIYYKSPLPKYTSLWQRTWAAGAAHCPLLRLM